MFLNQGSVIVEDQTTIKHYLGNTERIKVRINHLSTHASLIISVLNITVINQIRD